jgi:RNA-directed DNA polymerase
LCNTKITRITGWRLHYCVPRVMGGSHSAENRVLLHPECHDRVHNQRLPVSKPRLPERGVRRA